MGAAGLQRVFILRKKLSPKENETCRVDEVAELLEQHFHERICPLLQDSLFYILEKTFLLGTAYRVDELAELLERNSTWAYMPPGLS